MTILENNNPQVDYGELLCTATKIIVDKAITDIKFDQTIECIVKDASKASKGIYRVNNGSATFVAYSYEEYKEGDSVYVLVPNGDYNSDKTIIGRKVKDKTMPYHYVAPFDNLLDITGNLITADIGSTGLTANMPQEYTEEVVTDDDNIIIEKRTDGWEKKVFELTPKDLNDGRGYEDFTRLGLRASFQSWLSEYHCVAGNYGLRLEIIYRAPDKMEKSENPKDLALTQTEIVLDCADMIGNPYAFEGFYQQEKVFDIEKLGTIISIKGFFFQKEGSFIDSNKNLIPYMDEMIEGLDSSRAYLLSNLFVRDIYVSLGYDINAQGGEFVRIFSLDPMSYISKTDKDGTALDDEGNLRSDQTNYNRKTINLLWHHDNGDERYKMTKDSGDEFEIRWYRYIIGMPSADPYSGAGWTRIDNQPAGESAAAGVLNRGFTAIIDPNTSFEKEDIKAIVLYGPTPGYMLCDPKPIEEEYNEKPSFYFIKNENYQKYKEYIPMKAEVAINPGKYYLQVDENTYRPCTVDDDYSISNKYFIIDDEEYIRCNSEMEYSEEKIYYFLRQDTRVRYDSNVLTFTNEQYVPDEATLNSMYGLNLICKDIIDDKLIKSYGSYLIYNELNSLIDQGQSNIPRWIGCQLDFDGIIQNLKTIKSITWKIPIKNTMLEFNEKYNKNASYTELNDGMFAQIKFNHDAINDQIAKYGMPCLIYFIKQHYSSSYTNNYISCEIEFNGRPYNVTQRFAFGQAGTNGSDYTLEIQFKDDKDKNVISLAHKDEVELVAYLFDKEGQLMDISDKKVEWSWYRSPSVDQDKTDHIIIGNKTTPECKLTQEDGLSMDELYIIQFEISNWGDYSLVAFKPIPLTVNRDIYSYISGGDEIIYLSDGEGKVRYYPDKYVMHYKENAEDIETKASSVHWNLSTQIHFNEYEDDDLKCYYPTIKHEEITKKDENGATVVIDEGYKLKPALIYMDGIKSTFGIQFSEEKDGEPKWTQPIYIGMNKYFSSMINKWDGQELYLNEQNSSILAQRIGAGRKNSDNTFSGVLLGDWDGHVQEGHELGIHTGVYGFDRGELSYGFMDNGVGFLGKPSRAQIWFDGDKSQITSNSYRNNLGGILIDFDDSQIFLEKPRDESEIGIDLSKYRIKIDASDIYSVPLMVGEDFQVSWDGAFLAPEGTINNLHFDYGTVNNELYTEVGSVISGKGSIKGLSLHSSDYNLYLGGGKSSTIVVGYEEHKTSSYVNNIYSYYSKLNSGTRYRYHTITNASAFVKVLEETIKNPILQNGLFYKLRTSTETVKVDYDGAFSIWDGNPDDIEKIKMGIIGGFAGNDGSVTSVVGMQSLSNYSLVLESSNNIRLSSSDQIYLESKGGIIAVKEPGDNSYHPIYAYFA